MDDSQLPSVQISDILYFFCVHEICFRFTTCICSPNRTNVERNQPSFSKLESDSADSGDSIESDKSLMYELGSVW